MCCEAHRPLPGPASLCVRRKVFFEPFQNGMIEARAARYNLQAVAEAHARALGQRLLELVEVEGAVPWLGLGLGLGSGLTPTNPFIMSELIVHLIIKPYGFTAFFTTLETH